MLFEPAMNLSLKKPFVKRGAFIVKRSKLKNKVNKKRNAKIGFNTEK